MSLREEIFKEIKLAFNTYNLDSVDYVTNNIVTIFEKRIDELWETIPKPADKDCIYDEYNGTWKFVIKLKELLK